VDSLSTIALTIRESVAPMMPADQNNLERIATGCESAVTQALAGVTDPIAVLERVVRDVFIGVFDACRGQPPCRGVAIEAAATAVVRIAQRLGTDPQRTAEMIVQAVQTIERQAQLKDNELCAGASRAIERARHPAS
jgi:hypothetical protein